MKRKRKVFFLPVALLLIGLIVYLVWNMSRTKTNEEDDRPDMDSHPSFTVGGGEIGSIVMGKRPELYTAYLETSSQWDGNLEVLSESRTPVYMAIGANDSYYGSNSLKKAYEALYELYTEQGLTAEEIDRILVLDVKEQQYFSDRGYRDQHAGGLAFAHDEVIMDWLFGEHDNLIQ